MMDVRDLEKRGGTRSSAPVESSSVDEVLKPKSAVWRKILGWGVEENGIIPVPLEKRTDERVFNLFTVWFTALLCLLPIPTGMLGTLGFGLSLRDSSLIIIFFTLLTTIPPAYMGTLGPKTGMRQMIQARYAFGLFGISIILLLNAATVTGFSVIAAVVGGQTLAAVSDSTISINVGIVITCIIALVVSFSGYKILHIYERYSWIPVFVAIVILVGCGAKNLAHQTVPEAPATAQSVLTFASLIAGFMIPFGGIVSDFGIYIDPSASRLKVFAYIYSGMVIPTIPLLILGAAIGGAVPNVPEWDAANLANSVGGVVTAMLSPAGQFGKFVAVILALSVIGNIAISMYSIALNIQMFLPILTRAPRAAFSIITTVVLIPVSIEAAHNFFTSLENFLGVIGYWSASFVAIMIVEFVYIRKGDYTTYDHLIWRDGKILPPGIAALGAGIGSFGLVIPCMAQLWYEGPIAKKTGDIGFEVAFCLSVILYVPFRLLEITIRGGRL
ncbi:purine-cytosine permease FCY22 [Cadophora sp. MPI-SDFR-AT-0126]|nr:purine-cytosine permease FCY22 [Leotiomycetes sp. MPI-SDFR-AT-0126]